MLQLTCKYLDISNNFVYKEILSALQVHFKIDFHLRGIIYFHFF